MAEGYMMNEIMEDMAFPALFSRAISEWPESLSLVLVNKTDSLERYSVEGLGVLTDRISDAYIGHGYEVFYRNLHWAINTVVHELAGCCCYINLSCLRPEVVQVRFEGILSDIQEKQDWPKSSLDLIEKYFHQN